MFSPPDQGPEWARIPVRSRKIAMDWSLVLLSQGIDTVIEAPTAELGWTLVIPARERERAFKTLRFYHLENRNWPWKKVLDSSLPDLKFDWASLIWLLALIGFYWASTQDQDFVTLGVMDSAKVFAGHWWQLFTAMTLHADLGHLTENLSIGVVLMGLTMGRYGTGIGLLAAYIAGLGGNLSSLLLNLKPFHGLGASGMIMGALGLLAVQQIWPKGDRTESRRIFIASLAGGIMLFVLFGLTPGTDFIAHLGGFIVGLLLGMVLHSLPKGSNRNFTANFACGFLVLAVTFGAWYAAFAHRQ